MRARVFIITKVLVLTLILSALAIYYPSPSMVNAQCSRLEDAEIRVNRGLITAVDQAPFFQDTNVYCVDGSGALIPDWSVNTYTDMKTLYYDQANTTITKATIVGIGTASSINSSITPLLRITGNLTLDGNITVSGTRVIFVDGNLYINSPLTHGTSSTGLVFIVQGGIYISRNVGDLTSSPVNTINAFLISYGRKLGATEADDTNVMPFCSAWDGTSLCEDDSNTSNQKRLTINGSVISLNTVLKIPGRSDQTAQPPVFNREKSDDLITPAEVISYQPKYLIILKDIFSRDVKNWREIQ